MTSRTHSATADQSLPPYPPTVSPQHSYLVLAEESEELGAVPLGGQVRRGQALPAVDVHVRPTQQRPQYLPYSLPVPAVLFLPQTQTLPAQSLVTCAST